MKSQSALFVSKKHLPESMISSVRMEEDDSGSCRCSFIDFCKFLGISVPVMRNSSEIYFQHLQFKAGQKILTAGQKFGSIYVVFSGFLKTSLISGSGIEQILNFPMKGDILGFDGIYGDTYKSEVTALSECNLISLPFKKLITAAREYVELEEFIYRLISSELNREQEMISIVGSLNADSRVAYFLMQLSNRFASLGYSPKAFTLRMSREEIGSYLGLSMETVSRAFSQFDRIGAIEVKARHVSISNREKLEMFYKLPLQECEMNQ